MMAELIEQRARVYVLGEAVARCKRQHKNHKSLERQWVRETAKLVAMEATCQTGY